MCLDEICVFAIITIINILVFCDLGDIMKKTIVLGLVPLVALAQDRSAEAEMLTQKIQGAWQFEAGRRLSELIQDLEDDLALDVMIQPGVTQQERIDTKRLIDGLQACKLSCVHDLAEIVLQPNKTEMHELQDVVTSLAVGGVAVGLAGMGLSSIYRAYQYQSLLKLVRNFPKSAPAA